MVLEFLRGQDLEKLLMHHGELDESAFRCVLCTNNITQLHELYSDHDEVDRKLVPGKLCSLYLAM